MQFRETNVVCFGGGTGLPTLLSGLKHNPWLKLTAIVNMFDTGGSSGELRDRFGILPPGDVLKSLLALSEDEVFARKLLLKRIRNRERPGHTGGNVLLLGLEQVYQDYPAAIDALSQLLLAKGVVVPVTLTPSNLHAHYTDGSEAKGETSVDMGVHEGKRVEHMSLNPEVAASPQALAAIKNAHVICIGPGSHYTSVLPNFLPTGVVEAIKARRAKIVYIANLFTEGKGMQGRSLEDIVQEVEGYLGQPVDTIAANNFVGHEEALEKYEHEGKYPIIYQRGSTDDRLLTAPLWTDPTIARHDSTRLGYLVSSLVAGTA